ncbi:MAG: hypothetical protein M3083_01075 [Actinomycetota bacterium]|nr:hypothetical protein [Actinomycetota bacterium]MDQ6946370.1 hypothetical protein [Actinomycetota bacterium]
MGGLIEDNDPPGGGSSLVAAVHLSSPAVTPPAMDVERFVDRLRLNGFDSELADEAERRLRDDPTDGYRWLRQQLEQREPPPKPPTCDCGSALVEAGWKGRATVRCDQCGARWGVEVRDGSESWWAISGPSEEWRRAHPVDEEYLYGDYPPEDVLDRGLPPLPAGIDPGDWLPLATWSDDRFGAVLYVYRNKAHEFDSPIEEYEPDIDYLRRAPDGGWASLGGGGGGWINPFAAPEDLLQKYVVFTTGTAGTRDGDMEINFTGGLCRDDVAFVEVHDSEGVKRHPVDQTRRIFVIGAYGSPARARLLNNLGKPIAGRDGTPVSLQLS